MVMRSVSGQVKEDEEERKERTAGALLPALLGLRYGLQSVCAM